MRWQPISKPRSGWKVVPNLIDYERTRAEFSWATARRALDGLPGGRGLNIAHEAVDRHARGAACRVTSRCAGSARTARRATYLRSSCAASRNRFANVLRRLGVGKGERVFVLDRPRFPSSTSPRSAR